MDDPSTSADCTTKKHSALEELTKEELIKKIRNILAVAQKAKAAKDSLQEENDRLNSQLQNSAQDELIEVLTQQKLEYVSIIERLNREKNSLEEEVTGFKSKVSDGDNLNSTLDTENQGLKRQLSRLTDENEQLLTHLDGLEKQIEDLNRLGLDQREKLLLLEQNNSDSEKVNTNELQKMLSISLEEVKKLQSDKSSVNVELQSLKSQIIDSDKQFLEIQEDIAHKTDLIAELEKRLADSNLLVENTQENYDKLVLEYDTVKEKACELEKSISQHKNDNQEKANELESVASIADDLKTELHKNRALVEVLRNDIKTTNSKLSDNQIVSSGMTSDLENDNDKLRERIKAYHKKIVKFAIEVKKLKEDKEDILSSFKNYNNNVTSWKDKLEYFSKRLVTEINQHKEVLSNFNKLEIDCNNQKALLVELQEKLEVERKDNVKLTGDNDLLSSDFKSTKEDLNNRLKLIEELENRLMKVTSQYDKVLVDYKTSCESNNSLECNIKAIKEESNILLQEKEVFTKTERELLSKIAVLEKTVEKSNSTETRLAEKSSEEITKLIEQNESLAEQITKLERELVDVRKASEIKILNLSETEDCISTLKRENSELLAEMNVMNQALKERGERISQQQTDFEDLLKKHQNFETETKNEKEALEEKNRVISELQEKLNNKQELKEDSSSSLEEKNLEISNLKKELQLIKERSFSGDVSQDYADSEMMSTSTVSKAEELGRFKDLDGSWEERYTKLRNLALKLKAKIKELMEQLNKEQLDKVDLQLKLANSTRTVQNFQTQCDVVQDELDKTKKQSGSYLKKLDTIAVDISKDKKLLADNEELISKLKMDLEGFSVEKNKTEQWKKQVSLKVQTLKKELEGNAVLKKDYEARIAELNNKLDSKDKLLREEMEKHTHTKSSLLESNNECKKKSVLNLEMQDYEKTVKELSLKLEKKSEVNTKLADQVESLSKSTNSLTDQIRILEERADTNDQELNASYTEISKLRKQISDYEHHLSEKEIKSSELMHQVETTRREIEDINTELSKVMAEKQRTVATAREERDGLQRQLHALEQKCTGLEESLTERDEELAGIRGEYEGYKVRAQSVLRQNQARDVGVEEKLSEEVDGLRMKMGMMQVEGEEMSKAISKLTTENEELGAKKVELNTKVNELLQELKQQKETYDNLVHKYEVMVDEHSENVRTLKTQSETLAQCYRQTISEQEVRHNREVIELQGRMDNRTMTGSFDTSTGGNGGVFIGGATREEGEGSESVDSVNGNNNLGAPPSPTHPLEKILGGESEHESSVAIRRQLAENEARVGHLTALLSDTEQDLAKHVQMNVMLKEEIRRQQRSVEREKHAENLEYMKNVVFKFITLNNGDERQRLVPVLNTILKLSPEETQKLNSVAKGDRGWSNYLPAWPSKPQ